MRQDIQKQRADRRRPLPLNDMVRRTLDLYRALDDPFVVVDMRGSIVGSNAAFRRMVGYTAAELRQLTYRALTPAKWHAFEADIVRRQILPHGQSRVYEKEYRRKDGSVFPVELRTFLVRDAAGRPQAMWAIARDIGERKRMEAELGLSLFALEHLSLPAFWVAEDARITYVNKAACQSLGYTRRELLAMTIMDIDPTFPRQRWRRHWTNSSKQRARVIETCHRTKDGRVFPVEIAISVFRVDGRTYHCDFVRDISDRRKAEEAQREEHRELDRQVRERTAELQSTIAALRKAAIHRRRIERALRGHQLQLRALVSKLAVAEERERQRVAAGIHDDISQMLAAAKLQAGAIGARLPRDTESAALVGRLNTILNRIIDTARTLTFDLASPILHRIGLEAALEDICERMSRDAGVAFVFRRQGRVQPIETSMQEMIFQSAKELMRNVVAHAGGARLAHVRLKYAKDHFQFSVSDDGPGFGRSALKGFSPTGGFGLYAIRERIHYLGGRFAIRARAPRGSTVSMTIPLRARAVQS